MRLYQQLWHGRGKTSYCQDGSAKVEATLDRCSMKHDKKG